MLTLPLPENGDVAVRASEDRRRRVSGGPGLREDDDAVQNDEARMTVRSVSTGAPCCGVVMRMEGLRRRRDAVVDRAVDLLR